MINEDQKAKKRLQKVKCYRKQKLIKKADELARLCGLKVNLTVFDPGCNLMQEFKSCTEMNAEWIAKHKKRNRKLVVNG